VQPGPACICSSALTPLALVVTSSTFQRRWYSIGVLPVIYPHTMQMRAFTASPSVSRPCTRFNGGSTHRQRRAGQLQRRTVTTQANILEDAINTYALTFPF
jgi:cation transporter-like permease